MNSSSANFLKILICQLQPEAHFFYLWHQVLRQERLLQAQSLQEKEQQGHA
jgi:hypothetical protein